MDTILAAKMRLVCLYLEKFGFVRHFSSKRSESVYYKWPADPLVRIRVSCHPEHANQKTMFNLNVVTMENAKSSVSRLYSKVKDTQWRKHELRIPIPIKAKE